MILRGILANNRLLELPSLRRQEDDLGFGAAEFGERLGDRFDFHDHARTTPVGCIIDGAVAVMRPAAEVDCLQPHKTCLVGATKDAFLEDPFGDGGDGGEDLDLKHGNDMMGETA